MIQSLHPKDLAQLTDGDVVLRTGRKQDTQSLSGRADQRGKERRRGGYLAGQRRGHREGSQAVQGGRRGRARRQRRVPVHLVDVREPEVFLRRWPEQSGQRRPLAGPPRSRKPKQVVKIRARFWIGFERLMFLSYCEKVNLQFSL